MKWAGLLCLAVAVSSPAWAAYQSTGFTTVDIVADNGVTYFIRASGLGAPSGTCQYERLELRETGDYYGNVENGRRIYAMILAAQLSGKLIQLGYNDADAPACRISGVHVQW